MLSIGQEVDDSSIQNLAISIYLKLSIVAFGKLTFPVNKTKNAKRIGERILKFSKFFFNNNRVTLK